MPEIKVLAGNDVEVWADLDLEGGILRFSHADRDLVMRAEESEVVVEVEGVRLEDAVILNRLTKRIMMSESALVQAQSILAG